MEICIIWKCYRLQVFIIIHTNIMLCIAIVKHTCGMWMNQLRVFQCIYTEKCIDMFVNRAFETKMNNKLELKAIHTSWVRSWFNHCRFFRCIRRQKLKSQIRKLFHCDLNQFLTSEEVKNNKKLNHNLYMKLQKSSLEMKKKEVFKLNTTLASVLHTNSSPKVYNETILFLLFTTFFESVYIIMRISFLRLYSYYFRINI